MRALVFLAVGMLLIYLAGCPQPISVAGVDEGESTLSEIAGLETELEYNNQTYLGTFETIDYEAVEPTGSTVGGRQVYMRPGIGEEQIFLPNEDGTLELWVLEGAEIPGPDCPDDSWPVNGVCRVSEEDSEIFAEIWLEDSPTYGSAGLTYTLEHTGTKALACDYCWEFYFSFACYFPGYGFLDDTPIEQYGTYPHTGVARVEQGVVTSLAYDGAWDELNQRMLE